jgi:translation initiation factor eIF-2B subunit alpha
MDQSRAVQVFREWIRRTPEIAIAVAAIQALTDVVRRSQANTIMELQVELKAAADLLKQADPSSISLRAGCELFNRYVTRALSDLPVLMVCEALSDVVY